MTTLLLIRHGETDDNARGVFQGQGGTGLNELGHEQSRRVAERLAGLSVHHIVSSDLGRAVQTADAIAERLRLSVSRDPALREVDVGRWTGKTEAEIQKLLPDEWAAWTNGSDIPRGGGETYRALGERVFAAVDRIAREHPGQIVVVVSHGAAIRCAVAHALGLSETARRNLGAISNTAVTTLHVHEATQARRFELRGWNDLRHLEDPLTRLMHKTIR